MNRILAILTALVASCGPLWGESLVLILPGQDVASTGALRVVVAGGSRVENPDWYEYRRGGNPVPSQYPALVDTDSGVVTAWTGDTNALAVARADARPAAKRLRNTLNGRRLVPALREEWQNVATNTVTAQRFAAQARFDELVLRYIAAEHESDRLRGVRRDEE